MATLLRDKSAKEIPLEFEDVIFNIEAYIKHAELPFGACVSKDTDVTSLFIDYITGISDIHAPLPDCYASKPACRDFKLDMFFFAYPFPVEDMILMRERKPYPFWRFLDVLECQYNVPRLVIENSLTDDSGECQESALRKLDILDVDDSVLDRIGSSKGIDSKAAKHVSDVWMISKYFRERPSLTLEEENKKWGAWFESKRSNSDSGTPVRIVDKTILEMGGAIPSLEGTSQPVIVRAPRSKKVRQARKRKESPAIEM